MASQETTLSPRGLALASGFSYRSFATPVITNIYHPTTNQTGHINLGQAEHYAMLPTLAAHINSTLAVSPANLSYNEGCWGSRRLRLGLANYMNRHFKPVTEVREEEVLVSNGVMSMCAMLSLALFSPGEGILMPTPVYAAFESDFGTTGNVKCVYTPFYGRDQFSPSAAVESYERALLKARGEGVEVRAMMLCNPHNPLGRCYPRSTLIAIMQFCEKYRLHLLSDEIYALSTYSNPSAAHLPAFESALSFDTSSFIAPERVHILYGLSKDFAAGGLRVGMLHTRNQELSRAISAMTQFHWIGGADEEIACRLLEDSDWLDGFFAQSRASLSHLASVAMALFEAKGIPVVESNAGFFLWVDVRKFIKDEGWEGERELSRKFGEAKVWPTPGEVMKAEEAGWWRVVFSYEEGVLREGVGRMFAVLGV